MTDEVGDQRLVRAHIETAAFYRRQLMGPDGGAPRTYLAERGVAHVLSSTSVWEVGYAPAGWTTLTDHLQRLGFTTADVLDAGLAVRTRRDTVIDRFRDRVTIPIRDADGRAIAFVGRSAPHAGPRVPKYLNSPTTSVYRKGEVLFGLWQQRHELRSGARPVLVEGPFDVLAVTDAALASPRPVAAVAPCGTALTRKQVALMSGSVAAGSDLVVAYDSDPAGLSAAEKAYLTLRGDPRMAAAGELLFARLPKGLDPADLSRVHGPAALVAAVSDNLTPLVDQAIDARLSAFTQVLDGADGRIAAAKSVADLVATVCRDQGARYVVRLAHQLNLDPVTVSIAITDALAGSTRSQPHHVRRQEPAGSTGPAATETRAARTQRADVHGGTVQPPV